MIKYKGIKIDYVLERRYSKKKKRKKAMEIFIIWCHTMLCRGGGRVERAQVGDPLELHFTILDLESPYEIFVRELIAKVTKI